MFTKFYEERDFQILERSDEINQMSNQNVKQSCDLLTALRGRENRAAWLCLCTLQGHLG